MKKKKTSDALGRLFWQAVFRVSKKKKRQEVQKTAGGYFRQNVLEAELKWWPCGVRFFMTKIPPELTE